MLNLVQCLFGPSQLQGSWLVYLHTMVHLWEVCSGCWVRFVSKNIHDYAFQNVLKLYKRVIYDISASVRSCRGCACCMGGSCKALRPLLKEMAVKMVSEEADAQHRNWAGSHARMNMNNVISPDCNSLPSRRGGTAAILFAQKLCSMATSLTQLLGLAG